MSAAAPERATDAPVSTQRRGAVARAAELQRTYPIAQVVALIAIYLYGVASIQDFASRASLYDMLVLASLLGLVAAGQTLVLLIGGIDFSVPAFIVAGATLTVQLTGEGWSFLPILALVIAIPAVLGGIAGWIAHRFRIFPLVVTLAMGSIVTGGTLVWSQGLVLGSAPVWLSRFTSPIGKTFGLAFPPIAALWIVGAVIIGIVLHRTVAGRWIYATGSNARAADLALVRTRLVWVATFAFSAVIASVVGVLIAGFSGSGEQSIGDPYLWEGLTAVVIGGTAFGARGDYWRTVLGTLILTVLTTVLVGKGANAADQQILSGVLILVVVAVYGREKRLRDRV